MFTNYSQTYASQIAALVGFAILTARMFGVELAEETVVTAVGFTLNFGGMVWALYNRFSKGDVTVGGRRK